RAGTRARGPGRRAHVGKSDSDPRRMHLGQGSRSYGARWDEKAGLLRGVGVGHNSLDLPLRRVRDLAWRPAFSSHLAPYDRQPAALSPDVATRRPSRNEALSQSRFMRAIVSTGI